MAEVTGSAAEEVAPTCYRHSGRETWVRCIRCDRSICPDCMHDAAVGFQCPECVREGSRTVRERRTVFGGRVGADGTLTRILIGLNIVVFVLQLASRDEVTNRFALVSLDVAAGEYYRLVTAAFLHANLLHIGFNMYALLLFGPHVEGALGRSRFLGVYLLSAVGGSTLSYVIHGPVVTSGGGTFAFAGLGASGAVFGLFGAYFAIARRMRTDTSQIAGLILINMVLGFAMRDVIDNFAHLGGLVTGAGVTAAFAKVPAGPSRTRLQAVLAASVAVLLATLVVVRTDALRRQCPGVGTPVAVLSCVTSGARPAR